jgi:hypothetical protein
MKPCCPIRGAPARAISRTLRASLTTARLANQRAAVPEVVEVSADGLSPSINGFLGGHTSLDRLLHLFERAYLYLTHAFA